MDLLRVTLFDRLQIRTEGFRALYKGFVPIWSRMVSWEVILVRAQGQACQNSLFWLWPRVPAHQTCNLVPRRSPPSEFDHLQCTNTLMLWPPALTLIVQEKALRFWQCSLPCFYPLPTWCHCTWPSLQPFCILQAIKYWRWERPGNEAAKCVGLLSQQGWCH